MTKRTRIRLLLIVLVVIAVVAVFVVMRSVPDYGAGIRDTLNASR